MQSPQTGTMINNCSITSKEPSILLNRTFCTSWGIHILIVLKTMTSPPNPLCLWSWLICPRKQQTKPPSTSVNIPILVPIFFFCPPVTVERQPIFPENVISMCVLDVPLTTTLSRTSPQFSLSFHLHLHQFQLYQIVSSCIRTNFSLT